MDFKCFVDVDRAVYRALMSTVTFGSDGGCLGRDISIVDCDFPDGSCAGVRARRQRFQTPFLG